MYFVSLREYECLKERDEGQRCVGGGELKVQKQKTQPHRKRLRESTAVRSANARRRAEHKPISLSFSETAFFSLLKDTFKKKKRKKKKKLPQSNEPAHLPSLHLPREVEALGLRERSGLLVGVQRAERVPRPSGPVLVHGEHGGVLRHRGAPCRIGADVGVAVSVDACYLLTPSSR